MLDAGALLQVDQARHRLDGVVRRRPPGAAEVGARVVAGLRERPGGDRAADDSVVGQQLDFVAQADVAGRDDGAGVGRPGERDAEA